MPFKRTLLHFLVSQRAAMSISISLTYTAEKISGMMLRNLCVQSRYTQWKEVVKTYSCFQPS